jgi:outer membrane protein assembly factor BamB
LLRSLGLTCLAVVTFAAFPGAPHSDRAARQSAEPEAWLAYAHDGQLTNFVRSASLTSATAGRLRLAWSTKLDGAVVASPLYAEVSGIGKIVLFETEAGTVYALRPATGAVLWKKTLGTMKPAAGCGTWGLSSTGAIDLRRAVVYAISADGLLHALQLRTGADRPGWPIPITAARSDVEYVWGGLRLLRNMLYVPVASYCDGPDAMGIPAEGRLVGVDVTRAAEVAHFDPVQGHGNLGGIWGWGGVSVDPKGQTLFTGVGNSTVYDPRCGCEIDTAGYGDSIVKLTPSLRPLGWNRPKPYLSTGDYDFGASPLLIRPEGCPPLAAANSKLGVMYVWNRDLLKNGPIFRKALGDGLAPFVGQPSYSPPLRMLFESHVLVTSGGKKAGDAVAAFSVESKCKFRLQWRTVVGVGSEPPPLVVGDVVVAAGGDGGGYTALEARSGRVLWRFKTSAATLAPVIAAGGRVFAADYGGVARAFVIGARRK